MGMRDGRFGWPACPFLEQEITRNISIIAEGYTILERKLDECLKVNQEKELLLIRVTYLENKVRKLKEQINGINGIA